MQLGVGPPLEGGLLSLEEFGQFGGLSLGQDVLIAEGVHEVGLVDLVLERALRLLSVKLVIEVGHHLAVESFVEGPHGEVERFVDISVISCQVGRAEAWLADHCGPAHRGGGLGGGLSCAVGVDYESGSGLWGGLYVSASGLGLGLEAGVGLLACVGAGLFEELIVGGCLARKGCLRVVYHGTCLPRITNLCEGFQREVYKIRGGLLGGDGLIKRGVAPGT